VRPVHRHGLAIVLALLAVIAGVAWWRIGVIDVAPVAPGLYLITGVVGTSPCWSRTPVPPWSTP